MKRLIASIALLATAVLHSHAMAAEQSVPDTTNEVEDSFAVLKAKMAEAVFKADSSTESLSTLLAAYEEVISEVCMPNLLQAQHNNNVEHTAACHEYINKTLALHVANPAAICARDGLRSEGCLEAFKDHQLIASSVSIASNRAADLEAEELPKKRELSDALKEYSATHQPTVRTQIERLFYELIQLNCTTARVGFERKYPNRNAQHTPFEVDYREMSWLREHLEHKPSEQHETQLIRHIAASHQCVEYVNQALEFDGLFPTALCVKYGTLSPNCLNALHRNRRKAPNNSTRAEPSAGLARF